ncbi:MAG: polysaccharide biosynthesis protein [Desulfobacula sp.]|nr:polysaccharide biosynthesis protein [Desulfobacula sp.]
MMTFSFSNKRVLVTGACGTIGRVLVKQLLCDYSVGELIAIDNNESELFFLEQQFSKYSNSVFRLADIRDSEKLNQVMQGVDIVFHTAAFKHVALCERSPFEAVQTNIIGVQNVISAARQNKVAKTIFTSSDKAVNPTNVMGTSKLMGERLMTAANSDYGLGNSIFASTRFGNVLGSRGSVIPIFREQIRKGGPVTLTSSEMTRFIMSVNQAVNLVIHSARLACGGEVFVTKMPIIRIQDLAGVMINELGPRFGYAPEDIQLESIGIKPGEKLYEELLTDEEIRRTIELDNYFVVKPAFQTLYHGISCEYENLISETVSQAYNSSVEAPLSKKELILFLDENNLMEGEDNYAFKPSKRYWGDEHHFTKKKERE